MGVDRPDVGVLSINAGLLPLEPGILGLKFAEPGVCLFGLLGLSLLVGVI